MIDKKLKLIKWAPLFIRLLSLFFWFPIIPHAFTIPKEQQYGELAKGDGMVLLFEWLSIPLLIGLYCYILYYYLRHFYLNKKIVAMYFSLDLVLMIASIAVIFFLDRLNYHPNYHEVGYGLISIRARLIQLIPYLLLGITTYFLDHSLKIQHQTNKENSQ